MISTKPKMRDGLIQRGDSWTYYVELPKSPEGRRRQLTKGGFTTRKEANDARTGVMASLNKNEFVKPTKKRVAAFMRSWLDAIKVTVKPSTWAAYKIQTEAHIIPALGDLEVQQLTADKLSAFYNELTESGRLHGEGGLKARSVLYVHTTLRKALGDAVKRRELTHNPAEHANLPRQQRGEMHVWGADEVRTFFDYVKDDRLASAYVLATMTGLRRGELLGLRWGDLDFDAARISIVQTIVSVDNKVTFSTPKTGRTRTVALDPDTIEALREHRKRQLDERSQVDLPWPSSEDLIFSQLDGSPLHPGQFSDRFNRLVKNAGLPRIRFHDLRHTHATMGLRAGVPAKVISDRLGHSTVSMTLDIYSHVVPAMQEEAAAQVAALVFKRPALANG